MQLNYALENEPGIISNEPVPLKNIGLGTRGLWQSQIEIWSSNKQIGVRNVG